MKRPCRNASQTSRFKMGELHPIPLKTNNFNWMKPIRDLKIYVFYYEAKSAIQLGEMYIPIWAGKNNKPNVSGFTGDDTNENISHKNKYYSELTGLYWVWKNTKSDLVGSTHYRRYFTIVNAPFLYKIKRLFFYPAGIWKKRYGLIYTSNLKYWKSKILNEQQIEKIFETYEAIFPVRRKLKYNIETHYKRYHNIDDLKKIEQIITEYSPEYLNTFNQVLQGNRMFANNMFILKWETFDRLMEWLFTILSNFEKESDLKDYEGYQERIFGFLSERLITVWVIHNNLNYKELPLVYFKKLKPLANA